MRSKSLRFWPLVLVVFLEASAGGLQSSQTRGEPLLLNSPVDETTVVRFFYQPAGGDYFHFPLIFRAVEQGDPQLNTAPMHEEGRTAYISLSDMREVVQKLAQMDLAWKESKTIAALGSFRKLQSVGFGLDTMDIFVRCSKGTATTSITPGRICETLTPLDSALKTPRALWELHLFRLGYGCKVPGFDRDAYPDHI